MQASEIESVWGLWTRRFLQWALGSVLVIVALFAFTQLLMPSVQILACIHLSEPWIGFWGNIAGGVLGLVGALVAAFAAVMAVDRQLNAQRVEAREREREGVRELARQIVRHRGAIIENIDGSLRSLQKDNVWRGVSQISRIKVFFPDLNDTLLGTIAAYHPTTAFRIRFVQFGLTLVKSLNDSISEYRDQNHKDGIEKGRKLAAFAVRSALVTRIVCKALLEVCETLESLFGELHDDLEDYRQKLQALDNLFVAELVRLKQRQKDLGDDDDE